MDLRLIFAANLRRLRKAKGLSQEDLARRADVGRAFLSRVVGCLEVIGELATALKVEPAEFLKLPAKQRPLSNRGQQHAS
jgi:transcriptional regulator with XRE-family HTH domain